MSKEEKKSKRKARRNSRDAGLEIRLCKRTVRERKAISVLCCELTGYVCATVGVTMLLDLEKEKSYKK